MSDRPFSLECFEANPETGEVGWQVWSTYRDRSNAVERRNQLRNKGNDARVVDTRSGEIMDKRTEECGICFGVHPPPYDGMCLL